MTTWEQVNLWSSIRSFRNYTGTYIVKTDCLLNRHCQMDCSSITLTCDFESKMTVSFPSSTNLSTMLWLFALLLRGIISFTLCCCAAYHCYWVLFIYKTNGEGKSNTKKINKMTTRVCHYKLLPQFCRCSNLKHGWSPVNVWMSFTYPSK